MICNKLGAVIKSVSDMSSIQQKNQMTVLAPTDCTLVTQYKDLIREQDIQVQKLNQTVDTLMKEKQELEVCMNNK